MTRLHGIIEHFCIKHNFMLTLMTSMGTSHDLMISELGRRIIVSEFDSHWGLHTSRIMLKVSYS